MALAKRHRSTVVGGGAGGVGGAGVTTGVEHRVIGVPAERNQGSMRKPLEEIRSNELERLDERWVGENGENDVNPSKKGTHDFEASDSLICEESDDFEVEEDLGGYCQDRKRSRFTAAVFQVHTTIGPVIGNSDNYGSNDAESEETNPLETPVSCAIRNELSNANRMVSQSSLEAFRPFGGMRMLERELADRLMDGSNFQHQENFSRRVWINNCWKVVNRLNLSRETFYRAVQCIDEIACSTDDSLREIFISYPSIVISACILLSSKESEHEGLGVPCAALIAEAAAAVDLPGAQALNASEIVQVELGLFSHLQNTLALPSSEDFFQAYTTILLQVVNSHPEFNNKQGHSRAMSAISVGRILLDAALSSPLLLNTIPSRIAAASLYLALAIKELPTFEQLVDYCGYSPDDLRDISETIQMASREIGFLDNQLGA